MPDVEATAKSALSAGKETAWELLDIVFTYILPIVTLVVGYLLAGVLGLSGLLATVFDGTLQGTVSSGTLVLVADLVAAGIYAAIAGALWSARSRGGDGKIMRYIMTPLSTLFAGFALAEVGGAISGKVLNGQLGTLAGNMESRLVAVG